MSPGTAAPLILPQRWGAILGLALAVLVAVLLRATA